ncbi:unnamed protein product, partial [Rotaria socialis]
AELRDQLPNVIGDIPGKFTYWNGNGDR